ncbi:hypothetical protein CGC54_01240 [Capnocytophaga canimorsus]|uniref:HTH crp-type domain-containing protein n=1 Tax=Capnocytophaga canimorsus TaxID=28188 RepID=A0AAC9Z5H9_9FLAO|nr:type IV toxin-antitoxin system AbiEi family antitoxin [Capnocytophaga canimorsus]ATA94812.1 hypothetical protein CGC54_01240 [Capnocytophaga canimorsus]
MYKDTDFIYEAIANLEEYTGLKISMETSRKEYDAVLDINGEIFYVEAKPSARNSNIGIILDQISQYDKSKSWILIADYLAKDVADRLQQQHSNYLDSAGNAFIKSNNLFIIVEGKKKETTEKKNQSRAFQEVGLKLLLLLISDQESLQLSYRALAEKTKISLGSVSNIFQELEDGGFILKIKRKRVLKNIDTLLERWVIAYNEILKPRVLRKKYRLANKNFDLNSSDIERLGFFWGGESAAGSITNYLKSSNHTIYYDGELSTLVKELKMIPDANGNIEVYNTFWTEDLQLKYPNTAPPLVVYADLMGTNSSRNIEAAKMILENGL